MRYETRSGGSALRARRSILAGLCTTSLVFSQGCAMQTETFVQRHWDLNQAIRQTGTEQLLLNIVRLRYDEMPYFLQVSSITTTLSTGANVGAQASLPTEGPNVYTPSLGVSFSETPSITWSLPDSRDYLGRLMAPMGSDQLTVLMQSGWEPSNVLRLGAKKVNRLRNVAYRAGQGMYEPASYDELIEACELIGRLDEDGLVDLAYGVMSNMGAGKIPLDKLDTRAIPQGLQYGLQFMTRDDPNVFEPLKLSKPLFLRFSKESGDDPRVKRLRELLDLDPAKYSFAFVDTANSGVEQLRSESGKITQVFEPEAKLSEILLNNRSVMELLFLASLYVEVPPEDQTQSVARIDRERPGPMWLGIRTSKIEPSDAWLKVEYRGSWFSIAQDDVTSRANFMLLQALFASVVGSVPGGKPLLTLPVR